jgi:serine/threonine protein kinase
MGLDSFKMIKVIGKGSFGKVFLVRDISSQGRMYAMKVLQKEHIIRRNQVEHTKTERNVLGYIKHPFIVGLNFAFQTRDKLYFVLDYCAGGELFFHLGRVGTFPEDRARFYTAEIALALEHVHKLDIIYRDLKPENVLLDTQGHVRLTDFGLSKEGITNNVSGATSFCGTPEYLAPEILNRQGHGRAVDWWSLGALLYEMLTGLPPFYSKDRERLFEKIRNSPLTFPHDKVSRNARTLLSGLLTRDPKYRLGSGPSDAEEVKSHVFFAEADIDWDVLMKREYPAPWEPHISGSLDTSQFDKEFTNMPVFSPEQHASRLAQFDNKLFDGFTFTDENIHLSSSILPQQQQNFLYGSLHRHNHNHHHNHNQNHNENQNQLQGIANNTGHGNNNILSTNQGHHHTTNHNGQSQSSTISSLNISNRQGFPQSFTASHGQPSQQMQAQQLQEYQLQQQFRHQQQQHQNHHHNHHHHQQQQRQQIQHLSAQQKLQSQQQEQQQQYRTSVLGKEIEKLQESNG